jgi:hypothetical protein
VSNVPRLAFAAVAVAMLAGGCGHQSSQRPAVAAYIKQVNRTESRLAVPLRQVTAGAALFSREQSAGTSAGGPGAGSPERTLLTALGRIRALRGQVAALSTPPAAAHLRALALDLIDRQAELTREVAGLIDFLPRYNATLRPLAPATQRLEAVLSRRSAAGAPAVAAVYASKAAALRMFQASVDAILARLRRLRPPPVSKPGYAAQLMSLQGMGSSAGRLAASLAHGAPSNVQPLIARFDDAATSTHAVAVQRAEIAATRAYNSRSAVLADLSRRVALERVRLANTLQ